MVRGGHVTANTKDFSATALLPFNILATPPDDFICDLLADNPQAVVDALRADRASLRNPPMTVETYLAALERVGLVETVAIVKALGEPL